ncbi:D-2-hydroxyacid dehydrogenase [Vibrio navarrensis]|uniref:D-2-hydroxyacid dehydrogenase n=1 Tax=Vibrio navarrensis TaxID=29495 RepID=UPI00186A48A3|nr:D-2-hydroxyacid dehydrogenase [Vibrio navarrensis]MBE4593417.1 D-2-hydroxyacid dehydrogenase [Vibrio navarrensis]
MHHSEHKIFILTEENQSYHDLLLSHSLPELTITQDPAEADIVLAAPPKVADKLDQFPKLQWLQSTYAGVNALMPSGLRRDYTLTNVRGIFGPLIAEYVLGYSIAHWRHLPLYAQQQQQRQWQPHLYTSLQGKRVVILGTGSIGNHLAHVCSAMGLHTMGINRTGIPPTGSHFHQTYHINELAAALTQADMVVNTLPSTEQTKQLLNQASLSHCRQALLFNVGRGDVLDNAALLLALKNRWIEHAFLDVFEQEPLPSDHPFWGLKQITITPHIAALSFAEQVVEIFSENYQRWIEGYPLNYQVSFAKGY